MSKTIKVGSTGHVITVGNVYLIGPKADLTANDALVRLRTTKLPNSSGMDIIQVPYNEDVGIYDTGLFAYSPSLSGMDIKQAEGLSDELRKLVVEPIERVKGPEALDHKNTDFWDKNTYKIYNGRVLDTSKPSELMELYHIILYGHVCPKGREHEYDSKNAKAKYTFEDIQLSKKLEDEQTGSKIKAIGMYYGLQTQQDKLELVLYKLGMPIPKTKEGKLSLDMLNSTFEARQNQTDSFDFNDSFIKEATKVGTKEGLQELIYYRKVHELYKKGVIVKEYEKYKLDSVDMGDSISGLIDKIISGKHKEYKAAVDLSFDNLEKGK